MNKDIIITLPAKIKWEDYQEELDAVERDEMILNFKVPFFPKETAIGSKCYLVHKGYIRGWMKIVGFDDNDFICESTGKYWSGKFVERSGKFHKITPIPMKGFQGFRYFDKKIITGVKVKDQMRKAKKILKEKVIPQENEYQRRRKKR